MKINFGTWNLWRSTRLILGIVFTAIGFVKADYILAASGVFLIIHAWINACAACQSNACETPKQMNNGKV